MTHYLNCTYASVVVAPVMLCIAMAGLLVLIFAEYRQAKSIPWIVLDVLLIIMAIAGTYITIYQQRYMCFKVGGENWFWDGHTDLPQVYNFVFDPPLVLSHGICLLLIIYICGRLVYIRNFRKPQITKTSIKESFDDVPMGACFADKRGVICMCNRNMAKISNILFAGSFQHISQLYKAFENLPKGVTAIDMNEFVFKFPSGKIWKFDKSNTVNGDVDYIQIRALDVTELYEKQKELLKENTELSKANDIAKDLYRNLDCIVKDEETLAMKMAVHNDIGLRILLSRKCISEGYGLEKIKESGNRWGLDMNLISKGEKDSNSQEDEKEKDENLTKAMAEVVNTAKDIGVEIVVDGELPKNRNLAYILIIAIRECATNTVRHAKGNLMNVKIIISEDNIKMTATNNGIIPKKEIVEGGGLSTLRHRVEVAKGKMYIESKPVFKLTIVF